MFLQMRTYDTMTSQKEPMTSQKEFPPPEMEADLPMEMGGGGGGGGGGDDGGGATAAVAIAAAAAPPCDFLGNFLVGGECWHAGDSLTSPPHSATHDLCRLKKTFGPQNVRRRNEMRALFTTFNPRTKFDSQPCRVTALCYAGGNSGANGSDLLIADTGNAKVKRFSCQGQLMVEYIMPASHAGRALEPGGVGLLPNGHVVVADRAAHDLKVFTAEGRLITSFAHDLTTPCDLVVTPQGHVVVVQDGDDAVHIYERIDIPKASKVITSGNTDSRGDVAGTADGGLRSVTAVAATGNIVVADQSAKSLITYDECGRFISHYRSEDLVQKGSVRRPKSLVTSYSLGHLKLPAAVADDHHGNVLVLDGEHARVSQFDLVRNAFLREVIAREDGLSHPRCMAVGPGGQICVTEDDCDLVKVFDAKEVLGW